MKIIFVFVTVCAVALNLLSNVVNCDLRFPNSMRENPLHDRIGTKNGHTFMNENFDSYPKRAPHAPKSPVATRTAEPSPTKHRKLENVNCGQRPRAPLGPKSKCGEDGALSPLPVNSAKRTKFPHGPNGPVNPNGRGRSQVIALAHKLNRLHGPHTRSVRSVTMSSLDALVPNGNFSASLVAESDSVAKKVIRAWDQCKEFVGASERFFIYPYQFKPYVPSDNEKRLIDCTLRRTGVITDEGFQEQEYLTQIRKLMMSYVPFDMKKQSDEIKRLAQQEINHQLVESFKDDCHAFGKRRIAVTDSYDYEAYFMSSILPQHIPGVCTDLLRSYETAARECKNRRAPGGGISGETVWTIVECMLKSHRSREFNAAFYPRIMPLLQLDWFHDQV